MIFLIIDNFYHSFTNFYLITSENISIFIELTNFN